MFIEGFFILSRKITEEDSWVWKLRPKYLKMFLYVIAKANYKDCEWFNGKEVITIPRGSFVTSLGHMAADCGMQVSTVRRFLNKMKATQFIAHEPTQQYTLVKVLNYSIYQEQENYNRHSDRHTKRHSNNTTTTTIEEVNKERKKNIHMKPEIKGEVKVYTDLQRVVQGWKAIQGVALNDKAWDKVHFSRHSKPASHLLDLFGGDWKEAVHCMDYVSDYFEKKKLDYTLETVVKHSDLYRRKENGIPVG